MNRYLFGIGMALVGYFVGQRFANRTESADTSETETKQAEGCGCGTIRVN